MTTLFIATTNQGKINEIQEAFSTIANLQIVTQNQLKIAIPKINENGDSFEENAKIKAETIAKEIEKSFISNQKAIPSDFFVLADDSGLSVDALNGGPGIYSARFAGDHDDQANNEKLLEELARIPDVDRSATFSTVMVVIPVKAKKGVNPLIAYGNVKGDITLEPSGTNGFGYDPLFVPEGSDKTFAEMSPLEKQATSHRGRALKVLKQLWNSWETNERNSEDL